MGRLTPGKPAQLDGNAFLAMLSDGTTRPPIVISARTRLAAR